MPKVTKKEKPVAKRGAAKNDDGKKKKRKTKKDPNAPKAPMSAYLLFCEEYREKVKSQNPDKSFGELGRILGEMWRSFDEDKKAPYVAKHEKTKAKYVVEKAAYEAKKNQEDEDEDEDEESD
ncbi:high mobility group box domain-containing protein [Mortierella sp. GBAus27b]|nr:Non-histone chromosomal protein 6 [Mortierella sp. GBA43]KAI8357942.1 high mobility group box domain-containing protein [Mortierella sp. GBAus27b]